jgi:polyferredoxin
MHYKKFYFIITLAFFALGFVNIHLALSGILCMSLPLILLIKNRKKIWCQSYCPRASLYTALGKLKKHSRKTPRFFTHGKMKWIILIYFFTSLFIIIMSTIGVAKGRIPAMEYLRFLIFLPLPFEMPQLIRLEEVLPWITHLSYRFYSMMMTTTVLGLLLAVLYKPRSWCTICPIATVSDLYLNSARRGTGTKVKQ